MKTINKAVTTIGINIGIGSSQVTFFAKRTTTEENQKDLPNKNESKQLEQSLTK